MLDNMDKKTQDAIIRALQCQTYPELALYDEENQYDFDRDEKSEDIRKFGLWLPDLARYEVVFDVNGTRYYAFFDALCSDEALGQFFRLHQHICMSDVVEVLEV